MMHTDYYSSPKMQDCMMYSAQSYHSDYSMGKHYQSDSVQFLRCRRRMDLVRLQQTFKTHPNAVARRNERERNRVKHINTTFATLRQHLPTSGKSKKMSKVDTLRSAIRYIKHLQQILGNQYGDVTTSDCPLSPVSIKSEPATPSTCRADSPVSEVTQDSPVPDSLSPCHDNTSQGSPSSCHRSPYASDDAGYETLAAENDLVDLVDWFQ